jgi:hypothetical protein
LANILRVHTRGSRFIPISTARQSGNISSGCSCRGRTASSQWRRQYAYQPDMAPQARQPTAQSAFEMPPPPSRFQPRADPQFRPHEDQDYGHFTPMVQPMPRFGSARPVQVPPMRFPTPRPVYSAAHPPQSAARPSQGLSGFPGGRSATPRPSFAAPGQGFRSAP